MSVRRSIVAIAMGAALFAAGCSSDKSRLSALDAAKGVVATIKENRAPREASDAKLARVSAKAFASTEPDEPLSWVDFKSVGASSVLREIETNQDYTIWSPWGTTDRRTVVTKNGIIAATRGMSKDLMSAEVDAVLDLVTRREEGTVQYAQRYLDGNFQVIEAKSTCTVTRGYDKVVQLQTREVAVVQMFSSCISADRQFVDLFLVTDQGRIVEMRQWVGPVLGFAYMRALR